MDRQGGGFEEITALQKAKEILKAEKIDWADVVDFKLGYEFGVKKYFVSKWCDCFQTVIGQYGGTSFAERLRSTSSEREDEFEKIEQLVKKLRSILCKYFSDVNGFNMSYDPKSKKIYIFDLKSRK